MLLAANLKSDDPQDAIVIARENLGGDFSCGISGLEAASSDRPKMGQ
jgi:hypothetical protein